MFWFKIHKFLSWREKAAFTLLGLPSLKFPGAGKLFSSLWKSLMLLTEYLLLLTASARAESFLGLANSESCRTMAHNSLGTN